MQVSVLYAGICPIVANVALQSDSSFSVGLPPARLPYDLFAMTSSGSALQNSRVWRSSVMVKAQEEVSVDLLPPSPGAVGAAAGGLTMEDVELAVLDVGIGAGGVAGIVIANRSAASTTPALYTTPMLRPVSVPTVRSEVSLMKTGPGCGSSFAASDICTGSRTLQPRFRFNASAFVARPPVAVTLGDERAFGGARSPYSRIGTGLLFLEVRRPESGSQFPRLVHFAQIATRRCLIFDFTSIVDSRVGVGLRRVRK
jgi:hypothetical protein